MCFDLSMLGARLGSRDEKLLLTTLGSSVQFQDSSPSFNSKHGYRQFPWALKNNTDNDKREIIINTIIWNKRNYC